MNVSTKYTLIICAVLFLSNTVLGAILLIHSRAATVSQIQGRMLDVAKTAAAMLDGDSLTGIEADDLGSDACKAALKSLSLFQNNFDMAYIYCFRETKDGRFVFILDPSEDPAYFGEELQPTDAMRRASIGTEVVDTQAVTDRWGRFYSAYCPVFNQKHEVVCLVGVDFNARWFEDQMHSHVIIVIVISIISILAGIIASFAIVSILSKKIRLLTEEMKEFEEDISELTKEVVPNTSLPELSHEENPNGSDQTEKLRSVILKAKSELRDYIQATKKTAYTDVMTGTGNRAAYADRTEMLDRAIESGEAVFSVAIFDINSLKIINDTNGHEIGDRCIQLAARAITTVFGQENTFRIGGDEFIAIVNWADQALMKRMFSKVDALIASGAEKEDLGISVPTVSKGFSEYDPLVDSSYLNVFMRSDNDMYRNKTAFYEQKEK
ncbi:MAG: GGDEF domain-containing protein [Lachnospiraceae bacterium]|nr:GGDEF domain-containing protein [Lachnospiraceae bacterium]